MYKPRLQRHCIKHCHCIQDQDTLDPDIAPSKDEHVFVVAHARLSAAFRHIFYNQEWEYQHVLQEPLLKLDEHPSVESLTFIIPRW